MSTYQKSIPGQRGIPTRFGKSAILQIVKEIEDLFQEKKPVIDMKWLM